VTATGTVRACEGIYSVLMPDADVVAITRSAVVTESVTVDEHSLNVNALGLAPPE